MGKYIRIRLPDGTVERVYVSNNPETRKEQASKYSEQYNINVTANQLSNAAEKERIYDKSKSTAGVQRNNPVWAEKVETEAKTEQPSTVSQYLRRADTPSWEKQVSPRTAADIKSGRLKLPEGSSITGGVITTPGAARALEAEYEQKRQMALYVAENTVEKEVNVYKNPAQYYASRFFPQTSAIFPNNRPNPPGVVTETVLVPKTKSYAIPSRQVIRESEQIQASGWQSQAAMRKAQKSPADIVVYKMQERESRLNILTKPYTSFVEKTITAGGKYKSPSERKWYSPVKLGQEVAQAAFYLPTVPGEIVKAGGRIYTFSYVSAYQGYKGTGAELARAGVQTAEVYKKPSTYVIAAALAYPMAAQAFKAQTIKTYYTRSETVRKVSPMGDSVIDITAYKARTTYKQPSLINFFKGKGLIRNRVFQETGTLTSKTFTSQGRTLVTGQFKARQVEILKAPKGQYVLNKKQLLPTGKLASGPITRISGSLKGEIFDLAKSPTSITYLRETRVYSEVARPNKSAVSMENYQLTVEKASSFQFSGQTVRQWNIRGQTGAVSKGITIKPQTILSGTVKQSPFVLESRQIGAESYTAYAFELSGVKRLKGSRLGYSVQSGPSVIRESLVKSYMPDSFKVRDLKIDKKASLRPRSTIESVDLLKPYTNRITRLSPLTDLTARSLFSETFRFSRIRSPVLSVGTLSRTQQTSFSPSQGYSFRESLGIRSSPIRSTIIPLPSTNIKPITVSRSSQISSQDYLNVTRSISSQVSAPVTSFSFTPTPPPPGFGGGFGFTLPEGGGLFNRPYKSPSGRRRTQYKPSFAAIAFNIKGTAPKGELTGLEFRPIATDRKRRRSLLERYFF